MSDQNSNNNPNSNSNSNSSSSSSSNSNNSRFSLITSSLNTLNTNRRRTIFYPSNSDVVNNYYNSTRSPLRNVVTQIPNNLPNYNTSINSQTVAPPAPSHPINSSINTSITLPNLRIRNIPPPPRRISMSIMTPPESPPSRPTHRSRLINNYIENPYEEEYEPVSQNENTVVNIENLNDDEPSFSLIDDQPIPNNSADEAFELDTQDTLSEQVIENTVDNTFDKKCNLLDACLNVTPNNNTNEKDIFEELNEKMHKNIDEFIRSLDSNHEIQEIDKEMFEIHKTCDFEDNSKIDLVQLKEEVNNKIKEELGIEIKELSSNIKKWKEMLSSNLNNFFSYETKLKSKLRKLHKLHMWIQSAKEFGLDGKDCQKVVLDNLEKANVMMIRKEMLETKLLFQSLMELNKEVYGATENKILCSICFDNICDKLIIPCGHLICSSCYDKLKTTNRRRIYNQLKCHLCRSVIQKTQKIYFP